jgi:hypothetical protein
MAQKVFFYCCLFFISTRILAQNMIQRSASSVDIQLCVLNAGVLATQRSEFQTALLKHLQTNILSSTAVYLERQYTTLSGTDLCFLYVYQAPNPDYSAYAVRQFATMNEQILQVPFTIPSTGVAVLISCKVDAAQWNGDDLTYLGAPMPVMWNINDMLLWGSCLVSLLFLCLSGLCCYALCTKISPLGSNTSENNGNNEDNQILKVDKQILDTLLKQKREQIALADKMKIMKKQTKP